MQSPTPWLKVYGILFQFAAVTTLMGMFLVKWNYAVIVLFCFPNKWIPFSWKILACSAYLVLTAFFGPRLLSITLETILNLIVWLTVSRFTYAWLSTKFGSASRVEVTA